MKIKDLFFKTIPDEEEERHLHPHFDYTPPLGLPYGGYNYSFSEHKAMMLATAYRCVNLIASSMASLPLEVYSVDIHGCKNKEIKHPYYRILNAQPNQRMTRYQFIFQMVVSMLLNGNAYAYLRRNTDGTIKELVFCPPSYVQVLPTATNLFDPLEYRITGINGKIPHTDIIHILGYSHDGCTGVSVLTHARESLQLAAFSEDNARGYFSNGANCNGILTVNSSLTSKQKTDIKNSWMNTFSADRVGNSSGGICVLEGNMKFEKLSFSAADTQLLESRQYNSVDICRWFGVSPVKCFDYTHSSYSTVEAVNISFLTDTIAPLIEKFEQEFNRKLFGDSDDFIVRFDVNSLLRTDKAAQANYLQTAFNIGAMSVNEIRVAQDLAPIDKEEYNTHFVQANLLSLKAAANNQPANSAIHSEENTVSTEQNPQPLNEQQEQKTARKKK